jgi:hypothetical protein
MYEALKQAFIILLLFRNGDYVKYFVEIFLAKAILIY